MFTTIKSMLTSCYPWYTQRLPKIAGYRAASFPTCFKQATSDNWRKSAVARTKTLWLLSLVGSCWSLVASLQPNTANCCKYSYRECNALCYIYNIVTFLYWRLWKLFISFYLNYPVFFLKWLSYLLNEYCIS